MRARRLVVGPIEANCWLVDDGSGGPVVVIDPGDDAATIIAELAGQAVASIVLTHAHFDHIGAVDELRTATAAPLAVHRLESERMLDDAGSGAALFGMKGRVSAAADILWEGGEALSFGGVRARVLHTPGHSPGSICLLCEAPGATPHLFSGDTLFAGSVGRTDFPGGDGIALSRSISAVLAPLEPTTIVHPGHGPDTTVQRESRLNPFWPRA
jgi:hydroxyacylglutathione hydrolase